MKKILGIVLAFVMLVTVLAIIPAASDVAQEDGYYVYLDEGITLVHVSGGTEYRMPIAAKDLAKFPKLQDGVTTSEYSVKTYLTALMEKGQPGFLEDLMIALLNYGAAAQEYFGEAGALVGTPVTDTAALVAATAPEVTINDDSGIYIGATLILEGTIKLRFYFRGTDITANVGTVTNPEGANYSYVDVKVMPYAMADSVTVTVGTTSVTYAPLNYLKNKVADPELSTMVASIYAYGVAAKAYVDHVHDFSGEGAITLPATCTTTGVKTYTCPCGETKTETIEALGHNHVAANDVITQAYPCAVGTKTNICTRAGCGYVKTEAVAPTEAHDFTEYVDGCSYITTDASGKYVKVDYCYRCKDWSTYQTYDNYATDLNTAKNTLASTTISGSIPSMSASSSWKNAIESYPTKGEHPRLLVNANVLQTIKDGVAAGNEEMIDLLREVSFAATDYDSKGLGGNLGSTSSPSYPTSYPSGTHNYNQDILRSIMSKAFMYLYTGTDYYAVEATRWMKEYLKTLSMTDVNDVCRYYGYTMFATAIVYDWCYNSPAVTKTDRDDLVEGIHKIISGTYWDGWTKESNMEVGFPPSGQGSVSGHGCEYQILRDYLAMSLAIYDEYPTWYEYVGGRIYAEYVPVRNDFYEAGMYPQGISVYIGIRFESDLWSAWLLQSATGYNPYENQDQVIRSIFSRVVDGAYFFFDEGDDQRDIAAWGMGELKRYVLSANISAYLYNDETAAAWAGSAWNNNATWYENDNVWLYRLILRSTQVDNTGSRHEGLDLVCYNAGFMNEIVAHTGWTSNDVSVLMKIGGYTVGNHDHGDAGSFQIYYKGMLAGDTGFYDDYDDSHHNNYHQATIAHNSIVVYNGSEPFGQKTGLSTDDSMDYSTWLSAVNGKGKQGDVLGVSYKYDANGKPKYAYIAGDITSAYSSSSTYAKSVQRRMLTVFNTNSSDVPAYFFVYDRVKTGSTNHQATFLLHTAAAPTISGNTVTVTSNSNKKTGGQLVLQSVLGAGEFVTYSGDQKYYVNGKNYSATDDGYWGRVEIKYPKGSTTDQTMLNVMYITDNGKTLSLPAMGFQTDKVDGAAIGNTVGVFLKNTTSNTDNITFTAPNTGAGNKVFYYVSGMADGKWTITCGTQIINVTLDEDDGGLLVFNTFAGKEVTITRNAGSSGSSTDNELPMDPAN